MIPPLNQRLLSIARRVEAEAALWREEPIHRVAMRNKFLRPLRARQFHSFGPKSFIDRPAWLYGTRHIAIGDGVMFLPGAWLAVERPAWDHARPTLEIRDGSGARMGCTISAVESIIIEEGVGMGAYVTVIDS